MNAQEGVLLRIYVSEKDKHEGILLSDWIVRKARDAGLGGATVIRGIEGFGVHSKIHSTRMIDLSDNLPLVVEIIDSSENIDKLLTMLDSAMFEGIAITQQVMMRKYKGKDRK